MQDEGWNAVVVLGYFRRRDRKARVGRLLGTAVSFCHVHGTLVAGVIILRQRMSFRARFCDCHGRLQGAWCEVSWQCLSD